MREPDSKFFKDFNKLENLLLNGIIQSIWYLKLKLGKRWDGNNQIRADRRLS